jgi:hypothetical protein
LPDAFDLEVDDHSEHVSRHYRFHMDFVFSI